MLRSKLSALLPFAVPVAIAGLVACASEPPPAPLPPPTQATPLASSLPATPAPSDAGSNAQVALPADAAPPPSPAEAVHAALAASDRDEKDRALDNGRHAEEMLNFFGIGPGMKVGELVSGTGYTAELLARTVGENGVVWGENPPSILDMFAATPWAARLSKPVMKNVRRADRDLEAPFPADATNLDAVLMVLFYHDTVWMKADRAKMNKAVFDALKPGGIYGIVDHAARKGAGVSQAKTLHRIEEKTVIDEVTKAGFKLAAEGDFMKNPKDTHEWNASPMSAGEKRGTSDRFVLKFVKP
jgi:predicted methyltransferase